MCWDNAVLNFWLGPVYTATFREKYEIADKRVHLLECENWF